MMFGVVIRNPLVVVISIISAHALAAAVHFASAGNDKGDFLIRKGR